jgi:hypothetical protein
LVAALVIAGVASAGVVVTLRLTMIRAYHTHDSASYLGAARNAVKGRGLTLPWGSPPDRPLVHFPPLYPAVLAAIGFLGPDPLSVTRWLNALLFGANIALVAFAAFRMTRNRFLSCLAAVLVASSPAMLRIHTAAWSEPLFMFLMVIALAALHAYAQRPTRRLFFLACDATALALLCRWTGAPLVWTGLIVLCAFGSGGIVKRLGRCAAFGFYSCLPIGLWLLRNLRASGSATNRTFTPHPLTSQHISDALCTVSGWAVPGFRPGLPQRHSLVPMVLLCLGAACLAGLFVLRGADGGMRARLRRLPWAYMGFVVLYCAFLLVSISYFDRMTPLNDRILAPAYVAWLVSLLWMWSNAWAPRLNAWPVRGIAVAAWLVLAALQLGAGATFFAFERDRTRFTASSWDSAETALAESLPADRVVYSNWPESLYLLTGRLALNLPARVDDTSGQPVPDYQERLLAAVGELKQSGGRLIMFSSRSSGWVDGGTLRDLSLVLVGQAGRVSVYAPRAQPAPPAARWDVSRGPPL